MVPVALMAPPVRKPAAVTAPVTVAVVPTVSALATANVPLLPCAVATVVGVPPTLARMMRLCPEMVLLTSASLPLWLALKALPVPANNPVLFSTLRVPVVLVLVSARMNWLLLRLLRKVALLAVPPNIAELVVVSVIPGNTTGNVLSKLAWGIKLTPSYTMPTRLLLT